MSGFMRMKGLATTMGWGTTKAGNTGGALPNMRYTDRFAAPLAAAADTVVATVAAAVGAVNLTLLLTTLDFPRNLTITADAGQTEHILFTGTDQFGNVQTETIHFNGAATVVGTKVFKTLVTAACEARSGAANISVGIGSILGTSRAMNGLEIDGAVYVTAAGAATGVQETTRPVKGATADVHGVTFATALDPLNTYVVSYGSSEVR